MKKYIEQAGIFLPEQGVSAFGYSDGDSIEKRMLETLKSCKDVSLFSTELISKASDWPSIYHFYPQRCAFLWPFAEQIAGKNILEIGCGCGAISRGLGELGANITALDGSLQRVTIARERCRDLENIRFYCDNFDSFEIEERFDIVTLIGVLEYAPSFISGENPVVEMLKKIRRFLKDDGVILIAIENRLGLKYFNNIPEDHLAKPCAGIQDLYGSSGILTMGKAELQEKLEQAGFPRYEFHYPFPDYKFASMLLHPEAFRTPDIDITDLLYRNTYGYTAFPRTIHFFEELVWENLHKNGLLEAFSNSFLVAVNADGFSGRNVCASRISPNRKLAHAGVVEILSGGGEKTPAVRRRKISDILSGEKTVSGEEPYIAGKLFLRELFQLAGGSSGTVKDLHPFFRKWVDFLETYAETAPDGEKLLPGDFFDAIPANLIVRDEKLHLIDREYNTEKLSFYLIVFRGLFNSLSDLHNLRGTGCKNIVSAIAELWQALGFPEETADFDRYIAEEYQFVKDVIFTAGTPDGYQQLVKQAGMEDFSSDCQEKLQHLFREQQSCLDILQRFKARREELPAELADALQNCISSAADSLAATADLPLPGAIELFYASGKLDFDNKKKIVQDAVLSQNGIFKPVTIELPGEAGACAFRLDLGQKNDIYQIDDILFTEKGSGKKVNGLKYLDRGMSNNVQLLSDSGEKYEYRALTDDPNLIFVLPENTYSEIVLKVRKAGKESQNRFLNDLFRQQQSLEQENRTLQHSVTDLTAANQTLSGDIQRFTADRDAWKKRSENAENDRDTWKKRSGKTQTAYKELLLEKQNLDVSMIDVRKRLELLQKLYSGATNLAAERGIRIKQLAEQGNRCILALHQQSVKKHENQQKKHREQIDTMTREARHSTWYAVAQQGKVYDELLAARTQKYDVVIARLLQDWAPVCQKLRKYRPLLKRLGKYLPLCRYAYEYRLLKKSIFFNRNWYAEKYGLSPKQDPVEDFIKNGGDPHYDPSPLFSTSGYLNAYPEVSGNALLHFLETGWELGYQPIPDAGFSEADHRLVAESPFFDKEFYTRTRGLAETADPVKHYLTQGWQENADPSEYFSTSFYRQSYPEAEGNPLLHYLKYGRYHGYKAKENDFIAFESELTAAGLFDPVWYRRNTPGVGEEDPFLHFAFKGWKENCDPSPEFSLENYLQLNPDVRGRNPLHHYWLFGRQENRSFRHPLDEEKALLESSPFWDDVSYLERYQDIIANPEAHYILYGGSEGRSPSPAFDCIDYPRISPDIPAGGNPLLHFLKTGISQNSPILDGRPGTEPLDTALIYKSGLFDEEYYCNLYPEAASSGNPLNHFMQSGWQEGREPSEKVSVQDYLRLNPDIKSAGINPLTHMVQNGILEERAFLPTATAADQCTCWRKLKIEPALFDSASTPQYPENHTIAVHLHMYYTDMADFFIKNFAMIPQKFDLFISLPTSDKTGYYAEYFKKNLPNLENIEVIHTPNRGRDIAPFIVTFGKKLMNYDWICHLHTKRSPHAPHLAQWLDYIVEHLFGSPEQLKYIFSLLAGNARSVFPPAYHRLGTDPFGWDKNYLPTLNFINGHEYLKSRLPELPRTIDFSHGSMLWAKGAEMAGFLDLPIGYDDFPAEPIASDATLAHILERLALLLTSGEKGKAAMLFRKDDVIDHVRYNIMQEQLQETAGTAETKEE